MANVKIRLIVNTEEIPVNPTQEQFKIYCSFVDNRNSLVGIDPETYVTPVYPGQMIEWSGAPENPYSLDIVSIDSIAKERGKGQIDMFGAPFLIGQSGIITATILGTKGRRKDYETYTLRFTVIKNKDGSTKSYALDPKLQGHI
ncbi:MAG: hypothetical protein WBM43_08630 [Flavobacteriaceae bacterium]